LLRRAVGHELDADHEAGLPDLADVPAAGERRQHPGESRRRFRDALDELVPLEEVEAGERDSAAELVARERMAVEGRLALVEVAPEDVVDAVRRQRGRDGEVTAGEPFAEGEQVRLDALVLAGEPAARAAGA